MKAPGSEFIPSIRTIGGIGAVCLVLGTGFLVPHMSEAQVRTIRLPEDMCDVLRERPLSDRILRDIRARPDFVRLLEYVEQNCGDVAGLLIGPTGAIPVSGSSGGSSSGGTSGSSSGGSSDGGSTSSSGGSTSSSGGSTSSSGGSTSSSGGSTSSSSSSSSSGGDGGFGGGFD